MKLWNVIYIYICKLQYYTYIQQNCGQKPKPEAKSQVKPRPKSQQKSKTKSQEPSEAKSGRPKAKWSMQMGYFSSKMQQKARKSELQSAANSLGSCPRLKKQKHPLKKQAESLQKNKTAPKKSRTAPHGGVIFALKMIKNTGIYSVLWPKWA